MDFQVVILAGCEYAGLHPLTPDIPKMLLPIGNKPLLACVLDMLEGLVERFHGPVLIVTPPESSRSLQAYLDSYVPIHGLNTYEIVELPVDCKNTMQVLLHLRKAHVRTNLLLVSGDSVMDSEVLRQQLEAYRLSPCDLSVLLTAKPAEEKPLYALSSSRIVSIGCEEDGIKVHRALLRQFPSVSIRSGLSDCYCYLFAYDLLVGMSGRVEGLKGVKRGLVPKLVKHQMDTAFLKEMGKDKPLVLTYFLVPQGYFATRANTLRSYIDLNLKCCYPFGGKDKKGKLIPLQPVVLRRTRNNPENILDNYLRPQAQPPAFIKMISNDCIVGVNFIAGIGSKVVSSVIGRDVRLGAKASVTQSVVMDGVTIEDE